MTCFDQWDISSCGPGREAPVHWDLPSRAARVPPAHFRYQEVQASLEDERTGSKDKSLGPVVLNQRAFLPPREHLPLSGDIFGCPYCAGWGGQLLVASSG